MPAVVIDGVTVEFPFEPYEVQRNYMSSVLQCIKQRKIGLLESPTGTGKTSSLLCSALAWILQLSTQRERGQDKTENMMEDDCPLHIVYATRTHSQLKEAIREFKATPYRDVPMVVLGSREQLCVFPPVSKLEDHTKMECACKFYISDKAIVVNKNDGSSKDLRCHFVREVHHSFFKDPMDIEDLLLKSKAEIVCPYFATISAVKNSKLTFCPYDYVLYEATGNHHVDKDFDHHVNLKDAILIFDEGHNVQSKFEEHASASVNTTEIESSIEGIQKLISKEQKSPPNIHYTSALKSLKGLLSYINGIRMSPTPGKADILEKEFSSDEMRDFLDKFLHDPIILFDLPNAEDHIIIKCVASISNIIKFFSKMQMFYNHPNCFKLYLEQKVVTVKDGQQIIVRSFKFWCLDPSITMEQVKGSGVHCILITSGTLSPLSTIESDLGLSNTIQLENSHVIQNHQVMARIVMCGPDGTFFNSSYYRRFDEDYLKSLGHAVLKVSNIAKHKGVIVMFPSYEMLGLCKENWLDQNFKGTSLWMELSKTKEIFEEHARNEDFEKEMKKFKSCIENKRKEGAVLLGVFRGKIAEGLDLKDDYGRIIILVGVPYRPKNDPRLRFKLDYLFENKKINKDEWYTKDAYTALNQAMGRVIRHVKDYGAIFLFDYRYEPHYFPKWIRNLFLFERRFPRLMQQTEQFFSDVEERVKTDEPRSGFYQAWESMLALLEKQKISRNIEQLSKDAGYWSCQIEKLQEEKKNLEQELEKLQKENERKLQDVFEDEDHFAESDKQNNQGLSGIQVSNSDDYVQPSGLLSRKRQHSPEPPA